MSEPDTQPTPDTPRPNTRFVLEVMDAIRPIEDPFEVQAVAARMLLEHLDASRVLYFEMIEGKETIVHRDAVRPGTASMVGRYPWAMFFSEDQHRVFKTGVVYTVDDVTTDPRIDERRASFHAIDVVGLMLHLLIKGGRLVAGLAVHSPTPRVWREDEKKLLVDLAERTWAEVRRAHTELALRASEEKYRSLFTAIDEGVCIVELLLDRQGEPTDIRYLENNPAFERHTGLIGAEGRTHVDLTGVPLDVRWLSLFAEVVRSGQSRRAEGQLHKRARWHELSVARTGHPDERRLACVFKDVTERKDAEELMLAALEREQAARGLAERATKLRDDFIRVVSHELRTPLSAILVWSKVLLTESAPRERALAALSASAEIQNRLIEELLDMSRLDAGKVRLSLQEQDVTSIVRSATDILNPTARAREVELDLELPSQAPVCLLDGARLHQVLWNVVGNAIKFTPPGGHVRVTLLSNETSVTIEVRDDGRGIAAEFLPHVFERFSQADASVTRAFGGLGLGLSIARQLVEMHGGEITAESEGLDRGATFRIRLPRMAAGLLEALTSAQATAGDRGFTPRPILKDRRILVIEDEPHTRAVLVWLLDACGAQVVAVADGASAREAISLGATFDVLVCDLGLPGEDGCAVLRSIRALPVKQAPALALTAHVRVKDRERAMIAGFDAFEPKPVAPEDFLDALVCLIGSQRAPRTP